ncbi:MAG: anhydro-N-acetylmuramic acid kinase [Chloroflexota bacterium]|nr:anhydro-N-acetylmuramic acid kinase [Chloroflexota bacterium]
MSGTSADGVDGAVVRLRWSGIRPSVELVAHAHRPYPDDLRARILDVAGGRPVPTAELARLARDLTVTHNGVAAELLRGRAGGVAVIGVHGQTLAHLPRERATLQLVDAAGLAVLLRVPVVSDFRSADVAAGGEGAPLTPFADHVLFADRAPCVVVNVGGIANVTLIADDRAQHVVAFDTGPGNMVIDAVARLAGHDRDEGGAGARRGRVVAAALDEALAHPFFARRAPKSCGREEFGADFTAGLVAKVRDRGGSLDDALATATALTSRTIADAIRANAPAGASWREVLVGGGGAANAALMSGLAAELDPVVVRPTDDAGIPAAAREAIAFAILASYRLRGLPNTLPRVTGASRAVCAGALHEP